MNKYTCSDSLALLLIRSRIAGAQDRAGSGQS